MTSPQPAERQLRLLVVDDHEVVRQGLVAMLSRRPNFQVVAEAGTVAEALEAARRFQPELVIMDVRLPDGSGIEACRDIRAELPLTRVVILTSYPDEEAVFSAIVAGASGYLLKQTPPDELLAAIRDVHDGGSPMSSHIARKIVQSFQRPAPAAREHGTLSPREVEVLDLLAKGYLYKEIADKTALTYATVHTHIRHIYEKLHVRSRAQAVAKHLGQTEVAAGSGSPRASAMMPQP